MSFADWKRRSEACANVMTHSVPTRSNILRALQAAYKAGERAGRKQVEAVAENATRLAVLAEREGIAQYCEVRMCRDGRPHTCGASLAAGIRARSNEPNSEGADRHSSAMPG